MKHNVLVIDDELMAVRHISGVLHTEFEHISVTGTVNQSDAIAMASEMNLALAIVEFNLAQRTTGLELGYEIRKIHPEVPIIIHTAYPDLFAQKILAEMQPSIIVGKGDPPDVLIRSARLYLESIPNLVAHGITLSSTLLAYGEKSSDGHLVQYVELPWIEILKEIQRDPDFLWRFSKHPRKFEEFIAGAYKKSGWQDVIVTPQSNDKGRDIIVSAELPDVGRIQFVDECKAYSEKNVVTAKDVSRLVWNLQRDQSISKGIVTTTSQFAPGVYKEFSAMLPGRLELKDGNKLRKWLIEISSKAMTNSSIP